MKQYRLNRLFNAKSGRCFDVAIDHGFFNERGFLAGIENLDQAVRTVVAAAPDAEIRARTEALMKQGAAGIVYGRNIIQHADPAGMTRALMAVVHDGATAKEAAKFIKN